MNLEKFYDTWFYKRLYGSFVTIFFIVVLVNTILFWKAKQYLDPAVLASEIIGAVLILTSKIVQFRKTKRFSLGAQHMGEQITAMYLSGYFLMFVGMIVLLWFS